MSTGYRYIASDQPIWKSLRESLCLMYLMMMMESHPLILLAHLVDVLGEVIHRVLVDEPQRLAVAAVARRHLRECVALHFTHS